MTELTFSVAGARAKPHTATPTIAFDLRIEASEPVEALVLRSQIRIEPQQRSYDGTQKTLLADLFGSPDRWRVTLHALSWADVALAVPAFSGSAAVELAVPCTYDFDFAATRYLHAVADGLIHLTFLFSGSIFTSGERSFNVQPVSWSCEAAYRMPAQVWRDAMQSCYGETALLRVRSETLQDLHRLRALSNATSWDELFARVFGAVP